MPRRTPWRSRSSSVTSPASRATGRRLSVSPAWLSFPYTSELEANSSRRPWRAAADITTSVPRTLPRSAGRADGRGSASTPTHAARSTHTSARPHAPVDRLERRASLPAHQLDLTGHEILGQIRSLSGTEIVKHDHAVAVGHQRVDEVRPNEAGATGDQIRSSHRPVIGRSAFWLVRRNYGPAVETTDPLSARACRHGPHPIGMMPASLRRAH